MSFSSLVALFLFVAPACSCTLPTTPGPWSTTAPPKEPSTDEKNDDIILGQPPYRFRYRRDKLAIPSGAKIANAHGVEVSPRSSDLFLTYDHGDEPTSDTNCLMRFRANQTYGAGEFVQIGAAPSGRGPGDSLKMCVNGHPHGLTIAVEDGEEVFYHANFGGILAKTDLFGRVVWQNGRRPSGIRPPDARYAPTWFFAPPIDDSRGGVDEDELLYLCDGYGSDLVFLVNRTTGAFVDHAPVFGGPGGRNQHGKFNINHGCLAFSEKSSFPTMVISDRANSRLEFYRTRTTANKNVKSPLTATFEFSKTLDLRATILGNASLPCNLRQAEPGGISVLADLSGVVAILDADLKIVSSLDVGRALADHAHPHDAIFLPNGDVVIATWNPGRLSYWERLGRSGAAGGGNDVVETITV